MLKDCCLEVVTRFSCLLGTLYNCYKTCLVKLIPLPLASIYMQNLRDIFLAPIHICSLNVQKYRSINEKPIGFFSLSLKTTRLTYYIFGTCVLTDQTRVDALSKRPTEKAKN